MALSDLGLYRKNGIFAISENEYGTSCTSFLKWELQWHVVSEDAMHSFHFTPKSLKTYDPKNPEFVIFKVSYGDYLWDLVVKCASY